ncbi:cell envelope integrity protein CreD [Galbibacter sp. EGI 63066]|uniref:cell envelope integrity protein CreD n=1 Tax=Galbibacter sp. EGI 63066 TaxID=2993559 RepID=UPI0022494629|nr:cell envelope integrity protein CreD [Galbibacter sp. EGI 63066]MCX2680373.1 cell envelope integrity protein CreD [Galbibacter sp. EGI 63066]
METNTNKFIHWIKTSITARMIMVGFLTLVLLIPLALIEELIRERATRQQEVVTEINEKWGSEVLFYGPILKVPYKTFSEKVVMDQKTKKTYTESIEEIEYAYFFPESLNVKSNIDPEEKKRGIYTTAVYQSNITAEGKFIQPNFKEVEVESEDVLWDKAKMVVQLSNVKGVNQINLKLGDKEHTLTSKYDNTTKQGLYTLETGNLNIEDLNKNIALNYQLALDVKGSEQIRFVPIGKTTEAYVTSNWKTANFFGEFLPYNEDKISDDGFDAKWKILDINRPFSQQHFSYLPDLREFSFGVNFMIPVDEYQKSERSAKYGFLVIGLTFLVFFLIQSLSKINIHPFQYLMIGLALTMFYTLLVSISEHSNFLRAYLIAGVSVVVLISLYSKSILKNIKFPIFIGVSLTALYTFIYVIIQLENYALLVGSIGLFIILAIVMYVSRKIDWNNG